MFVCRKRKSDAFKDFGQPLSVPSAVSIQKRLSKDNFSQRICKKKCFSQQQQKLCIS
jgi:hypothetical protein